MGVFWKICRTLCTMTSVDFELLKRVMFVVIREALKGLYFMLKYRFRNIRYNLK